MKSLVGLLLASGSAWAATHSVKVGDGGLKFDPSTVIAKDGDTVDFLFVSDLTHSVAQSNKDTPCQPSDRGFWSGQQKGKTFSIKVNGTDPIYFYCAVDSHCASGMVGTINGDLSSYESSAKSATSKAPNGNGPVGGTITDGTSGSGTSGGNSTSGSSTASGSVPSSTGKSNSGYGSSTGSSSPTPSKGAAARVEGVGIGMLAGLVGMLAL